MNSSSPPTPAARELRIRRNCPGCGARLLHSESARTIQCSFCRSNVAILPVTRGEIPRFAVPIEIQEAQWLVAAKRHLRETAVRVRVFEAAIPFYAPFYRLSTEVLHWWIDRLPLPTSEYENSAGHSLTSGGSFRETLDGTSAAGEIEFRIGSWEQTLCAVPDLGLPDRTLGIRTQAIEVAPLDELFTASGVLAAERPARLRATLVESNARSELDRLLAEAHTRPSDEIVAQEVLSPAPTWQIVYWPYAIVPFEGIDGRGTVLIDARSGRVRRVMGPEFEASLRMRFEHAPGDPKAWDFPEPNARYVHLACPNCSAPIAAEPESRVFPCQLCRRTFGIDKHELREIGAVALSGTPSMIGRKEDERARSTGTRSRRDGPATGIPFFRILGPGSRSSRWIYVPAALSQQPRPLWNLARHFTRRQPQWVETDTPRLPFAVALDAESARLRAPFVESYLEAEGSEGWRWQEPTEPTPHETMGGAVAPTAPVVQLVWIVFYARGSEWVEPVTGLGVPARTLGRQNVKVAP